MQLSIIIPVYNASLYLKKLIDSILQAGISEYELILIDDGSTDNSFEICKSYSKDYSFISSFTQKNAGPSAARNAGLKKACGKYIIFFDSDDSIIPVAFYNTIKQLDTFDADLWISDLIGVSDTNKLLFQTNQIISSVPFSDISYFPEFFSRYHCYWNPVRYIFKHSFLKVNNLHFKEGFNCAEDCEFITRAIIEANTICFYHNPYYCYHIHYAQSLNGKNTLDRLSDTLTMLDYATTVVQNSNFLWSKELLNKLGKEYLFNLAIYTILPKNDKLQAKILFRKYYFLNKYAFDFVGRIISITLDVFGIPITAFLLNIPKQLRRLLRKIKG